MISESSNEMALSELIEKPPESWKDYNSFMNHQNNQMLPQEYIVHYDWRESDMVEQWNTSERASP